MRAYAFTLRIALRNQLIMFAVFIATIVLTIHFYRVLPKGYLPDDDTGLIIAMTEASADISFSQMSTLQARALGHHHGRPSRRGRRLVDRRRARLLLNQGRMFISLKPLAERGNVATALVIDRLRKPLGKVVGLATRLVPSRDIRVGAREGKSEFQYTLWSLTTITFTNGSRRLSRPSEPSQALST